MKFAKNPENEMVVARRRGQEKPEPVSDKRTRKPPKPIRKEKPAPAPKPEPSEFDSRLLKPARPMNEIAPRVYSADFVVGATSLKDLPDDKLPQIAFLGRSNVGKSSLLAALMGKKGLVKISAAPGKTRELNFFRVNDAFYFVDLPGIGYAKVSIAKRAEMGEMIRNYVERSTQLRGIVYLVDMRHAGTPLDIETVETLRSLGKPVLVVANKRDKLSQAESVVASQHLQNRLGLEEPPMAVSAVTRFGFEPLWESILEALAQP